MNITRSQVITEALEWEGTKWKHCQSNKRVATDCVGFILGVGKNIGFLPPDLIIPNYPREARGKMLIENLERYLIKTENPKPGDILVFERMRLITHVGILLNNQEFIHANGQNNVGVIKSSLDTYKNSIIETYSIPDIQD